MDLFDYMRQEEQRKEAPLASRIRPKTLDEIIDTLSLATGKSVSPELKKKIKKTIKEDKVPKNLDKMF